MDLCKAGFVADTARPERLTRGIPAARPAGALRASQSSVLLSSLNGTGILSTVQSQRRDAKTYVCGLKLNRLHSANAKVL